MLKMRRCYTLVSASLHGLCWNRVIVLEYDMKRVLSSTILSACAS